MQDNAHSRVELVKRRSLLPQTPDPGSPKSDYRAAEADSGYFLGGRRMSQVEKWLSLTF
jgi:hypothetical protein